MVKLGLNVSKTLVSDNESIPSLNCNSKKLGANAKARVIFGAVVSGIVLKTEFTFPGVPPKIHVDAIQLSPSEHGSIGFINSSE